MPLLQNILIIKKMTQNTRRNLNTLRTLYFKTIFNTIFISLLVLFFHTQKIQK